MRSGRRCNLVLIFFSYFYDAMTIELVCGAVREKVGSQNDLLQCKFHFLLAALKWIEWEEQQIMPHEDPNEKEKEDVVSVVRRQLLCGARDELNLWRGEELSGAATPGQLKRQATLGDRDTRQFLNLHRDPNSKIFYSLIPDTCPLILYSLNLHGVHHWILHGDLHQPISPRQSGEIFYTLRLISPFLGSHQNDMEVRRHIQTHFSNLSQVFRHSYDHSLDAIFE